ncbi:MAG: hypothetical protein FJ279_24945, partial [Planctomycetes bacterium]|nr:hypothetical protein [Planctomycetota bacterium]
MFKGQESRAQDYVNGVQRIGLYDIWPPPTIVGSYVEPILPQDLVAPYGKVLQDMHRAGWEPVTHARCAPSSVQVERYGPRDAKTYFALFNPTAAEAQVT